MKKIIVGNWKMYGSSALAEALVRAVAACLQAHHRRTDVVLCPPATLAQPVSSLISGLLVDDKALHLYTGGQDCAAEPEGAYTGDISANLLKDAGCSYVIIGHSERRQHHGETSATVRKKAGRALASGLKPIICIGETLAQRQAGKTAELVGEQVRESLPEGAAQGNFILAYEPVWAIGSGKIPTLAEIEDAHHAIAQAVLASTGLASGQVSVLYGGSVKPDNARAILSVAGVAGVLVGGASLKAEDFCAIIEAAE